MKRYIMYVAMIIVVILLIVISGGCRKKDNFPLIKQQENTSVETNETLPLTDADEEFYEALKEKFHNAGIYSYESPKDTPSVDFTLENLDGEKITLSDFKGQAVVLNFWATWCGPCISEMPSMESLYKELKNEGFVLLAVNLRDSKSAVEGYVKKAKVTFPILLDTIGEVGATYGANSIPLSYFIDTEGFVVGAVLGAKDWNTDKIKVILRYIQNRET